MKLGWQSLIFIFLNVLQTFAFADNLSSQVIEVPEQCIRKQETPCVVKAQRDVQFLWQSISIRMQNKAVLQIGQHSGLTDMDIVEGQVSLHSVEKYKIFGLDIQNPKTHFVSSSKNQKLIFDSDSFDLKILREEKEQIFVLQKSETLDRKKMIFYLADFFTQQTEFRQKLSSLLKDYDKVISKESKKQDEFIKNRLARNLASIQETQNQRNAIENQKQLDRKKSHELFFMRTFQQ